MPPHPLPNFEIQRYYQNKSRFNGIYSRNNLTKTKDGACVTNLHEYKLIETHWIALYVNGDNVTYFDSFGFENISKETKKFIDNKNITRNIYRIQGNDSTICGYFCIGLINFMLNVKSLLDYTNLFYRNEYEKYDKIILKYFE